MIIVDASVFNKLFLDEPDREMAQNVFRYAIKNNIELVAPSILLYEALSAALHYQKTFNEVHHLLELQRAAGMRLIEPSLSVLAKAQEITTRGNKKSGFPALFDCIYHALAIELNGTFITADKRHVVKTKEFGHACLLENAMTFLNT